MNSQPLLPEPRPRLAVVPAGARRPRVIAHRGASADAPENTLLAFQLALEAGAEMIETDAHLTRDAEIALVHDADLARTTDCSGSVSDRRAGELARCDAGYWFAPAGTTGHPFRGRGVTIPTLRDLAALLETAHSPATINVEIKNQPDDLDYDPGERLADRLVAELVALGLVDRVLVSSFNPASIDRVKALDRRVRTAYLCAPWADLHARLAWAVARGHDALHPHHALLGQLPNARRIVELVHAAGLEINVWTVNDPERMRTLAHAGVDGIIADDPGLLRSVLASLA